MSSSQGKWYDCGFRMNEKETTMGSLNRISDKERLKFQDNVLDLAQNKQQALAMVAGGCCMLYSQGVEPPPYWVITVSSNRDPLEEFKRSNENEKRHKTA